MLAFASAVSSAMTPSAWARAAASFSADEHEHAAHVRHVLGAQRDRGTVRLQVVVAIRKLDAALRGVRDDARAVLRILVAEPAERRADAVRVEPRHLARQLLRGLDTVHRRQQRLQRRQARILRAVESMQLDQ
jgi:hypothetical protein